MKTQENALVIGGGIVGVCCALYLQRAGYSVTLVDPEAPGHSTAKWSCGQIALGEVIPLSKPGILRKVPGWLLDSTGPLALRPSALPGILPWFVRFAACARPARIRQIATELASLTRHALDDYAPLLADCASPDLIGNTPVLEMFDTPQGLAQERHHFALRKELGFQVQELTAHDIADLEPALAGQFQQGLLFSDWRQVRDTEGFIVALTESFVRQGGQRLRARVVRLHQESGRASGAQLDTNVAGRQHVAADVVVLAAGVGSKSLLSALGVDVPLAGIGGYQALVKNPGVSLRHSVIYADGGFAFSPMTRGLQIGGTIEFAADGAQPDMRRAEMIVRKAQRALPALHCTPDTVEYGVGWRPFVPDTKPVIDRSPRLANVLLAFGHGQLGLTLGATTGRLVAQMARGEKTAQDITPFRASRF